MDNEKPRYYSSSQLLGVEDSGGKPLWGEYIREGLVTLLAGHPKDGKTTLMSHVINLMGAGGNLAGPVAKTNVLVVSEEAVLLWKRRIRALGLGDHVFFMMRQFLWGDEWAALMKNVTEVAVEVSAGLVFIDTFSFFAAIDDENSSAEIQKQVKAAQYLGDAGSGVVLSHHKRKAGGSRGMGVRGSSAFTGAVDIILELSGVKNLPRHRRLTCLSRYGDVEDAELVLSMDGMSYTAIEYGDLISPLLGTQPPGLMAKEVMEKWVGDDVPTLKKMREKLDKGVAEEKWHSQGKGGRHHPKTYWKDPSTLSLLGSSLEEEDPS